MLEYLLKVSVIIVIAFLFYKAVLQQESFFATNRFYLVGCIVLAFILPFVALPKLVEHQGLLSNILQLVRSAEEPGQQQETPATAYVPEIVASHTSEVEETAPLAAPRTDAAEGSVAQQAVMPQTETQTREKASTSGFGRSSWLYWVLGLYFFGVIIFSLNLIIQVASIFLKVYNSPDKIEDGECVIVNIATPQAPCSFFKYIFIYPDDYDFETYEQIIAHEKIHVRLGHRLCGPAQTIALTSSIV